MVQQFIANQLRPDGKSAIRTLLLWALVLGGQPSRELFEQLGVGEEKCERLLRENATEVREIRQCQIVVKLLNREVLGQLLRLRLGEMLLTVKEPRQLAALIKASAQLPVWAFEEEREAEHEQEAADSSSTDVKEDVSEAMVHEALKGSNGAGSTRVPAGDSFSAPASEVEGTSDSADEAVTSGDGGATKSEAVMQEAAAASNGAGNSNTRRSRHHRSRRR